MNQSVNTLTISQNSGGLPPEWISELNYMAEFPSLPVDWDGFGALPVSAEVVSEADNILKSIYNLTLALHNRSLRAPEIDPIPNDGIYAQFKKGEITFLLSIKRNSQTGIIENGYFGQNGAHTVKGKLDSTTISSVVSFLDDLLD
jgi:hypothetical protein